VRSQALELQATLKTLKNGPLMVVCNKFDEKLNDVYLTRDNQANLTTDQERARQFFRDRAGVDVDLHFVSAELHRKAHDPDQAKGQVLQWRKGLSLSQHPDEMSQTEVAGVLRELAGVDRFWTRMLELLENETETRKLSGAQKTFGWLIISLMNDLTVKIALQPIQGSSQWDVIVDDLRRLKVQLEELDRFIGATFERCQERMATLIVELIECNVNLIANDDSIQDPTMALEVMVIGSSCV